MSRLRARLGKLRQQAGAEPGEPANVTANSGAGADVLTVRQRLEKLRRGGHAAARGKNQAPGDEWLAQKLGGRCAEEGLIAIEQTIPLGTSHGGGRIEADVAAALSCFGHPVAADSAAVVFMDTETTGLAGGTGTLVFLLGLARLTSTGLDVRQYFLTAFKGEAALLRQAQNFLANAQTLVTYNGKSFDHPLLQTRYRLAGMKDPFATLQHIDLLHPTRRAYSRYWPDCRLQTAEQRLLELRRIADLPGAQLPETWFRWVRQGMAEDLPRLVRHNHWDLVSLVALLPIIGRCHDDPLPNGGDITAIVRHWLRHAGETRAYEYLRAHRAALDEAALLELARLGRRRGEWELSVEIWHHLAARGSVQAMEQLAKYYEHVARDRERALWFTRALMQCGEHMEAYRLRETRLLRRHHFS